MSLYDLRNEIPVWNGTESVSYLSPKIWDLAPSEAKESASLNAFKFEIKSWGGFHKDVHAEYGKYILGK